MTQFKQPSPLTRDEVAELDAFGILRGSDRIPPRISELWAREIIWGRLDGDSTGGILS